MVSDLPEQLIAQAEFLIRQRPLNEANVRRAVSAAYYAIFHMLIRDAVLNWKQAAHHSRLARIFDHKHMKNASTTLLGLRQSAEPNDPEQSSRRDLAKVAQAFVDLQQARQKADYEVAETFNSRDAELHIAQARLAFQHWEGIKQGPLAQNYLYSLLFRDKS